MKNSNGLGKLFKECPHIVICPKCYGAGKRANVDALNGGAYYQNHICDLCNGQKMITKKISYYVTL